MNLVLFLLCSGFVHFTAAANRFRRFYLNDTRQLWNDSLSKCESLSMSLVTLYDEADAESLQKFVSNTQNPNFWLGLQRIRKNVTTWSNGDPSTFINNNLSTGAAGEQRCGAVESNSYTGFVCNKSLDFMCYKGNEYHLIENLPKDWCQAQLYCRRHFVDLVSINDDKQQTQVFDKGRNKTFWIGLLYDEWEWQDKSCSTYRSWKSQEPSENCTVLPYSTSVLKTHGCTNDETTLCSKGKVRIVVIRKNLTWEKALDYCLANHSGLLWIEDEQDQHDVVKILENFDVEGPFWIGLRQSRVFGFWIWSDRWVTYSNWEDNKPPEMPLSENCGVFNATNSKWRDENCLHEHPFLCEEEISFNN